MPGHQKKRGHWLFKLKDNQHELYAELSRLWRYRRGKRAASEETSLISGRVETRCLYTFPQLEGWQDWPGLTMGLAVATTSINKRTGEVRQNVRFAITDLAPETPPDQLLGFFRRHWGIENRLHYVLDESLGEDRSRVTSNPGLLSVLRKIALVFLQTVKGNRSIPQTMRSLAKHGWLV